MASDNLLVEISPPLLEALDIPGESGSLTYFSLLGIDADNPNPLLIDRAVMGRSRVLRAWQNSPQHGAEVIKLLPMLHRIAAVLKDPVRRDAYQKEIDRRLKGEEVDALAEFQDMTRAALVDGTIDRASKAELLRYASEHNIAMNEAGRILNEFTAVATRKRKSADEAERAWEFSLTEKHIGQDAFRWAVDKMLERGALNPDSSQRMIEDAEKFSVTEREAEQIVMVVAAKGFREMVEQVARGGVLNNNQARLLMPKAAALGLDANQAYSILSDYTFTGASQEDLSKLELSSPGFEASEIGTLLAKQKTVHYLRRRDKFLRILSPLTSGSLPIFILVCAGAGGIGYFGYMFLPGPRISRPAATASPTTAGINPAESGRPNPIAKPTYVPATPVARVLAGSSEPDPDSGLLEIAPEQPDDPGAFEVKITEVTCSEYKEFLLATLHTNRPDGWGVDYSYPDGSDNLPVTGIRWEDATAYCKWVAVKMEVRPETVRLPTVAEYKRLLRGSVPGGKATSEKNFWLTSGLNYLKDLTPAKTHAKLDTLLFSGGQVYDLMTNAAEWGRTENLGQYAVLGGDFHLRDLNFNLWSPRFMDPHVGYPEVGFRFVISNSTG